MENCVLFGMIINYYFAKNVSLFQIVTCPLININTDRDIAIDYLLVNSIAKVAGITDSPSRFY